MTHASDAYFEAQVTTATPQRLRLMLVEGAIRFARATLQHWENGEDERALETLIRCENIVAELLASVATDNSDVAKQTAAVYLFVLKHLTQSQLRHDAESLLEVIGVLQVERETWRQVCEEMPMTPSVGSNHAEPTQQNITPVGSSRPDEYEEGGFSSYA